MGRYGTSPASRARQDCRRASIARGALLAAVAAGLVAGTATTLPAQNQCINVEDFAKSTVGEFPDGWRARKDSAKGAYAVSEEGGRRFLRADAKDLGIQIGKEFAWDLDEYPVLAWSWRPVEFPEGADERTKKNDSALAVYAVFPHTPVSAKSMKYIWSEKVPPGTHIPQSSGNTQGVILRSGPNKAWVDERVNVLKDYRRYFKTEEVPKPQGIGVLTDSDDTGGRARGDYARFRVCRG